MSSCDRRSHLSPLSTCALVVVANSLLHNPLKFKTLTRDGYRGQLIQEHIYMPTPASERRFSFDSWAVLLALAAALLVRIGIVKTVPW